MKNQKLYLISAFVCGFVVMAVEMSASRLLAPYFGNSLYVWTNVIGLVMVSLSCGYYFGGRIADRHPNDKWYFSLILMTGIWILMIPFFGGWLLPFFAGGFHDLYFSVRYGSFFAFAILFLVPLLFLGAIVPFTVKLYVHALPGLGAASGRISTISTIGSLLGTFAPAFILIPFLGTMKTFILLGLLLIFLAWTGLKNKWIFLLGIFAGTLFFFVPSLFANSNMIANNESSYGFIFVTETPDGVRRLHLENQVGTQSIYDPKTEVSDSRYYYGYFGVLPRMVEPSGKVLILGHAAGTFTRLYNAYYPEFSITGVEIDPAVTKMAEEYMGLDDAKVNVVHADARTYLLNTDEKYDLILVDAYHAASIPAHLATQEFFELCKKSLNDGGVLAVNLASSESEFKSIFENSLAEPFGGILSVKIPGSFNTMLIASDSYEFDSDKIPQDLSYFSDYVEANRLEISYDSSKDLFVDDKLSKVEILDEKMFFELLRMI